RGGRPMKLEAIELRRIALPLVSPFRTSFGAQTARDILLLHVLTPDGEGWAECVALSEPSYSYEYVEMAQHVIRYHLAPRLFAAGDLTAAQVAVSLAPIKGHPMAKAALETAVLDAELRAAGLPLSSDRKSTRLNSSHSQI